MWPRCPERTDPELQDLIDLCLNNLDGFSTVLFMADKDGGPMRVRAFQSLSKNIDPEAVIGPGEGLVGWVYKNRKPVNVDQFDFDSERLLFYKCDENIKSFMAVPMDGFPGVLAVDSKQRYVFTDKSAKLLFQFGQTMERVWRRLSGPKSGARAGAPGSAAPGADSFGDEEEMSLFWHEVEELLARPGGLASIMEYVKEYTGLEWAFLTALLPGDARNYHLVAQSGPTPPGLSETLPMASGLAGWVSTKQKPLLLDKLKADGQHSYIFHKDEPLKKLGSFYGWPLLYQGQPRGTLILAGGRDQTLAAARQPLMECLALRLAAQLQQDRLVSRVLELGRLDPQTALPHRSYFLERLGRLMELASVKNNGLQLYLLAVSGLSGFSLENGQEAARELLYSIAGQLLSGAKNSWELGHISYGVFALAAPAGEGAEARNIIAAFKKRLEDWPLSGRSGRADLGLTAAEAVFPQNAATPEALLEEALTALTEDEEDEDE